MCFVLGWYVLCGYVVVDFVGFVVLDVGGVVVGVW